MFRAVLAIGIGAALGALLRWVLSIRFNALFPMIPAGTLTANIVGAYIAGLAVAYFANHPMLGPEWRLFVITGFAGGLTTFSTFSVEVVSLIQQDRLFWAMGAIAAHLFGSMIMVSLGMATVLALRSS